MSWVNAWQGLLDLFTSKIPIWKLKTHSIGGKLNVLNFILGSLGSYYMFVFDVPVILIKALEAIKSDFFKRADVRERKFHWIMWSYFIASILDDRLGVGTLCSFK